MNNFNKQLFATKLLVRQKENKLSVRKASKEIGISASTLSRINNQQIIPDLETFYLCVKWIGMKMEFFFDKPQGDNKKNS